MAQSEAMTIDQAVGNIFRDQRKCYGIYPERFVESTSLSRVDLMNLEAGELSLSELDVSLNGLLLHLAVIAGCGVVQTRYEFGSRLSLLLGEGDPLFTDEMVAAWAAENAPHMYS